MRLKHFNGFQGIALINIYQVLICTVIVILMANLNALVDYFLHPDIPYLDKEHLVVGGVTGLVTSILSGILFGYLHHLEKMMNKIESLESILPVCSSCKKIRKNGSDPTQITSWEPIESYIMKKTRTKVSHGICPECIEKLYPEHIMDKRSFPQDSSGKVYCVNNSIQEVN